MFVTSLQLTNVRGFTNIEIPFQPGINVLAGVNGSGKSTILDSLAIMATVLRSPRPHRNTLIY